MLRTQFVDPEGYVTPKWGQWLQEVADTKMREVSDASIPPAGPAMKKNELIVFKATGLGITYLVYFDGTNRYYWESTGSD